ncbi:TetR/AcrR family transcriptional regulator [Streptomyces sp. CB01881]|uniref:TetR/AcrR family transcriptional regulator n=1 Tax=Streptomyces sp. CB01881 TaxID=2078691 RepID=UPI0011E01120|nr:TetR/AcrR family transcriptional regulator [Streptomyces sp. CB01881]TYC66518.1 TetR/AcrR family transcriptional regulator [Streptomyces sp. CB01881]
MAVNARARLLSTAESLFYANGIHAVGVERILSESGVGRASFYRHFAGKEALVTAVLEGRDQRWRAWLSERVAAHGGHPLTIFDALAERFAAQDYRGCVAINTMTEISDRTSPARHMAALHKTRVIELVEQLMRDADVPEPEVRAKQFALLMDGAIVTALREGTPDSAWRARGIAEALLAS